MLLITPIIYPHNHCHHPLSEEGKATILGVAIIVAIGFIIYSIYVYRSYKKSKTKHTFWYFVEDKHFNYSFYSMVVCSVIGLILLIKIGNIIGKFIS